MLNINLPYDPAILLPREVTAHIHTKTYMQSIAILFITAKN